MPTGEQTRMRNVVAVTLGPLLLALAACGGGRSSNVGAGANPAATPAAAVTPDPARLDAEIARLERLNERNPADDEARLNLARAYVRRAEAHRAAGRLAEALADYRRALRTDPDNEEAQKNVADITPQVEGTPQEGEYGEPAPPPISPNVTEGGAKETPTPE
ncbi:MAG TPA: tetratricopeptide repeat protein [Pyrinomonadaceae bacterium]|nr:tetratricopeptide repeat protein [Pyrinomonadaceae bacterium]